MPNDDILAKLNRLLAVTPETQLAVPPISRRTLSATVKEIYELRKRVAELESQRPADNAGDQTDPGDDLCVTVIL